MSPAIDRHPGTPVPPGLDEEEQVRVMLEADRQGMRRPEDDLTALPSDMPPPGGGWRKSGTLAARGSGTLYTIYILSPTHSHEKAKAKPHHKQNHHPPGRGPTGSTTNQPVNDPHTMAVTQHRPNVPAGIDPGNSSHSVNNPVASQWLAASNNRLTEAEEALRQTLDDPNATEEQITARVKDATAAAREVALRSGSDEPRSGQVMQLAAKGVDRIADMRNEEFDNLLDQEARSPGSVSQEQFNTSIQRSLGAERNRELMGGQVNPKAVDNVVKAIGIVADRKADDLHDLIDQDKQNPGSVTSSQLQKSISDLIGVARNAAMLGISRPATDDAMANVAEAIRLLVRDKTDALQKLKAQKDAPDSGITDEQIQQATEELNKMKQQARGLGILNL